MLIKLNNLYLVLTLLSAIVFTIVFCGDNIDTKFPITFSYRKVDSDTKRDNENIFGSYFGYSSSVYQLNDNNYVLIGAPKYQSKLYGQTSGLRSGAIFHCIWKDNQSKDNVICNEIDFNRERPTNHSNLGSSLTVSSNYFVGCAHLWVNSGETVPTPLGRCFRIGFNGNVLNSFGPNTGAKYTEGTGRPLNSHLMMGFTAITSQTVDSNSDAAILLGAPGYLDFLGSVIRQWSDNRRNNQEQLKLETLLEVVDNRRPKINSYLGYAMTTALFDGNLEYVVMGAPRHNHFDGKVLIQPLSDFSEKSPKIFGEYLNEVNGKTDAKGEYFGSSLLALDINNDKFDDLIVGAPLYSNDRHRELGRIYVFLMNDKGTGFIKERLYYGHKSGGRFGTAMSSTDINLDGYEDAIIGAPYEANSDGSLGAVYVYMGSESGLNPKSLRIGAESMKNVVLNGFGISITSSTDFDGNGYNDILIGSYLSENALLLRTKPMANLNITRVTFKPNKIRLHDKKCNNNQNSCFKIEYCIQYEGKHIRDKQSSVVTLEITDSKLRVRENRVKLLNGNNNNNNMNKFEQKSIELKANQQNCFQNDNSFALMLNEPEYLIDIITAIEVKLSVELTNDSSNSDKFCKDCAIAPSYSSMAYIDFEHGCQSRNCVSKLNLQAVSKYSGQRITGNLIEGLHDTIDIEISIANSGEASLNTVVDIKMSPVLLELTNSAEADRCKPMTNTSSYRCEVSRILQKNSKEILNLHFIVSKVPTNEIQIDFKLNSDSDIEKTSKLSDSMNFEIIRKASLMLLSEATNNFSFSDKTPRVSFHVSYSLVKSGPSSINTAFIQLLLPQNIIVPDSDSHLICERVSSGSRSTDFQIINKTLNLICDKNSDYCSKWLCRLPNFNSGAYTQPFTLSLALIPSRLRDKNFNQIIFKLNTELKVEDKVKFETPVQSFASMTIFMARDVPIADEVVEPWVLFLSAGFGVFILIITVIVMIRYGFFRRKKLEEIQKVKQRMSMRPDMYDINVLDLDEEDIDEMSGNINEKPGIEVK